MDFFPMEIIPVLVSAVLAKGFTVIGSDHDNGILPIRCGFQQTNQPADLRIQVTQAVVVAVDQRRAVRRRQRMFRPEPAFRTPPAHNRVRKSPKPMAVRRRSKIGAVYIEIVNVQVIGA